MNDINNKIDQLSYNKKINKMLSELNKKDRKIVTYMSLFDIFKEYDKYLDPDPSTVMSKETYDLLSQHLAYTKTYYNDISSFSPNPKDSFSLVIKCKTVS